MVVASLRDARASLLADTGLRGAAFGRAYAELLDITLRKLYAPPASRARVALVALGSYGRRELCPGSDIDVMLLYDAKARALPAVRELAEALWYPLWDASLVTGHATRTVKESLALAADDLDALTAIIEARHLTGDATLTRELVERGRRLVVRRRDRVIDALAGAAERRRVHPGPVAEVLEPDLKAGAGGLRDIQALEWGGYALGEAGLTGLIARGLISGDDAQRLDAGRDRLLDLRVTLHRITGGRSDQLALQEQDAVAAAVGARDADELVRDLATAAREVAWIARDVWMRLSDAIGKPPAGPVNDRVLAEGVVARKGRVTLEPGSAVSALRVLDAAAAAAEIGAPFDRETLVRLQEMAAPTWDVWERAAFLRLLRAGERAVPVFEALDHQQVLVRILPEWEHVRSRPQRNAYHRFTVDRHLLEAVAECAVLLDAADIQPLSFDGVVARACRRPELLLLGALLHDIGKGKPGGHSDVGAEMAEATVRRIGLDSEGREIVTWLVRHHLLMADVATRRDLSDATVADNLATTCSGDAERLRLLYLLTIGDSRATGPAAWGLSKAALVRDLFTKAAAAIERGAAAVVATDRRELLARRLGARVAASFLDRLPDQYLLAFDVDEIVEHHALVAEGLAVRCRRDDGHVTITVVAPDRRGLLATLAGALTVCGLDVIEANLFGTIDGLALDVFRAIDPFGRVSDGVAPVEHMLHSALNGELDADRRVAERQRHYQQRGERGPVAVDVDLDESATDTLVEVHADDEIGLLYRLATTFVAAGVDVRVAKVATLGQRVVDVFYVRDSDGAKVEDLDRLDALRSALIECLTR